MNIFKLTIVALIVSLSSIETMAQESKFKALFLYKFSEYVQWPNNQDKVVIGVLGQSDVFDQLSAFAKSRQTFEVRTLNGAGDIPNCDIVFMPNAVGAYYKQYRSAVGGKSILLVCDDEKYADQGCDICFYFSGGKLGFVINKQNIEDKNMVPSSKLLALGKPI